MKFFILGLAAVFAGIPLLDINYFLGVVVIGVGAVTASWFKGQAIRTVLDRFKKPE